MAKGRSLTVKEIVEVVYRQGQFGIQDLPITETARAIESEHKLPISAQSRNRNSLLLGREHRLVFPPCPFGGECPMIAPRFPPASTYRQLTGGFNNALSARKKRSIDPFRSVILTLSFAISDHCRGPTPHPVSGLAQCLLTGSPSRVSLCKRRLKK